MQYLNAKLFQEIMLQNGLILNMLEPTKITRVVFGKYRIKFYRLTEDVQIKETKPSNIFQLNFDLILTL